MKTSLVLIVREAGSEHGAGAAEREQRRGEPVAVQELTCGLPRVGRRRCLQHDDGGGPVRRGRAQSAVELSGRERALVGRGRPGRAAPLAAEVEEDVTTGGNEC